MNRTPNDQAPNLKDSAQALEGAREKILKKPALRQLYEEVYDKYQVALSRCPIDGVALELGSGAGFAKGKIPEITTSEVIAAAGIDRVVDATHMPFRDGELRAILMLNVFHHIPDSAAFLKEAARCLKPGGRIFMVDQHVGFLSRWIYAHLHDEPFNPEAREWKFETSGRMSGANGALTWMVFYRDREKFQREFPGFRLESYSPHTPFRYWWCGGLKGWTLLPGWAFGFASRIDRIAAKLLPGLCSFVDVELVRLP